MRWRTLAALALLLAVTAAFYWRLTISGQYTWLASPDMAYQVRPWLDFEAREFHAGRFPLWDPYEWAGQPLIGLANGWFYKAAKSQPSAFYDITKGSNDLSGVGCCQAAVGYDLASGLGVPNWAVLPGSLPPPG